MAESDRGYFFGPRRGFGDAMGWGWKSEVADTKMMDGGGGYRGRVLFWIFWAGLGDLMVCGFMLNGSRFWFISRFYYQFSSVQLVYLLPPQSKPRTSSTHNQLQTTVTMTTFA